MSVFKDKKYEELDWISQATEPIDSKINESLSHIPDKIEITFQMYTSMLKDSWHQGLRVDRAITVVYNQYVKSAPAINSFYELTYDEQRKIQDCFKFELEGNPELNYDENAITNGKIYLVKAKAILDEDDLKNLMIRSSLEKINSLRYDSGDNTRYRDVFEVLGGCDDGIRSRSLRSKKSELYKRVKTILEKNEWNIKSHDIAVKMSKWIVDYLRDGNLSAYSNFCRLKVMTHLGQPIYSMEEVV